MDPFEELAAAAYEDVAVTQVIRPSAILPESAARLVLLELAKRDARDGGLWSSTPALWQRWAEPWDGEGESGTARLIGGIHVNYGTPTKYAITIFRVTISQYGDAHGWTVQSLCDEALAFCGLSLADCPKAELSAPPRPYPGAAS